MFLGTDIDERTDVYLLGATLHQVLTGSVRSRAPADRPATARAFRDQLAELLHRRSALALSDAAAERLAQLQALLDGAGSGRPPNDLAAAYRLATEGRAARARTEVRELPLLTRTIRRSGPHATQRGSDARLDTGSLR
jgi:hypothetical protein